MRQQFYNAVGSLRGQGLQGVPEVRIRVVSLRQVNQAHPRWGTLTQNAIGTPGRLFSKACSWKVDGYDAKPMMTFSLPGG